MDMLLIGLIFLSLGLFLYWKVYKITIVDPIILETELVSLSGEELHSGDKAQIKLNIKNTSAFNISDIELKKILPKGFFPIKTEEIKQNKLNIGENLHLSYEGLYFADTEEKDTFIFILSFLSEKVPWKSQKSTKKQFQVENSRLHMHFEAPKRIFKGNKIKTGITLENTGKNAFEAISVPLEALNPNIEVIDISLGNIENNTWHINKLESGEKATINVKYTPILDENMNYLLKLQSFTEKNGKKLLQETKQESIAVSSPNIAAEATFEKNTLAPGEKAKLNLKLDNFGEENLKNIELVFTDPNILANGYKINSKIYPNLAHFEAKTSKTLSIEIPINNPKNGTENVFSPTLLVNAELDDSDGQRFEKTFQLQEVKLGANPNFFAEIHYFTADGDQIGRGPLPATVGEKSKFWAIIQLKNANNGLKNTSMQINLPSYAHYTGKSSISNGPNLMQSGNTLSWNKGNMAAHDYTSIAFEIEFTPSSAQTGTLPALVSSVEFTATDSFTERKIEKMLWNLGSSVGHFNGMTRERGIAPVENYE